MLSRWPASWLCCELVIHWDTRDMLGLHSYRSSINSFEKSLQLMQVFSWLGFLILPEVSTRLFMLFTLAFFDYRFVNVSRERMIQVQARTGALGVTSGCSLHCTCRGWFRTLTYRRLPTRSSLVNASEFVEAVSLERHSNQSVIKRLALPSSYAINRILKPNSARIEIASKWVRNSKRTRIRIVFAADDFTCDTRDTSLHLSLLWALCDSLRRVL